MAPPGGDFFFRRSKTTFHAVSHATNCFGYVYPSGELQKFWVDLKLLFILSILE